MTALGDLQSLLHQQTHQGLADLEAHCDKLMLMVMEHTGKPQCKAVSPCDMAAICTGPALAGLQAALQSRRARQAASPKL